MLFSLCFCQKIHIKTHEIVKVAVINDNNNFAPSLFRSLCEFVGDCFGPRYFSSGAALPQKNTLAQNNHLRISHNDLKKDGAQLLLSKSITRQLLTNTVGPETISTLYMGCGMRKFYYQIQRCSNIDKMFRVGLGYKWTKDGYLRNSHLYCMENHVLDKELKHCYSKLIWVKMHIHFPFSIFFCFLLLKQPPSGIRPYYK